MTMSRMRIACWIPKATHTHSELETFMYYFSKVTMVAGRRQNVTLYEHCLPRASTLIDQTLTNNR